MVVYDEKLLSVYSKKIKKGLWLSFLPFSLAVLLCVGLCFLLDDDKSNANLLHFLNVAICTLIGWYSLSMLFGYVLPNVKRKKLVMKILSYASKQVRGTITNMTNGITVQEGIGVLEIQVNCEDKKLSFYFDEQYGAPDFKVGDILLMTIAHNFILAYEVEDCEKQV